MEVQNIQVKDLQKTADGRANHDKHLQDCQTASLRVICLTQLHNSEDFAGDLKCPGVTFCLRTFHSPHIDNCLMAIGFLDHYRRHLQKLWLFTAVT